MTDKIIQYNIEAKRSKEDRRNSILFFYFFLFLFFLFISWCDVELFVAQKKLIFKNNNFWDVGMLKTMLENC